MQFIYAWFNLAVVLKCDAIYLYTMQLWAFITFSLAQYTLSQMLEDIQFVQLYFRFVVKLVFKRKKRIQTAILVEISVDLQTPQISLLPLPSGCYTFVCTLLRPK